MRVSPAFHELAGPLLYSNIVIKRTQLMLKVILGLSQTYDGSDHHSTEQNSENRKAKLLSHVQQITVADHYCVARISAGWFPNLKTLLILPYADTHSTDWICGDHGNCLVLNSVRPQKVVIHNSRTDQINSKIDRIRGVPAWPMGRHPLRVTCPTLTLVINDIECGMGLLPSRIRYKGVDWAYVKEIRVIVNRTPPWLDKIAERASYPDPPPLGSRRLAMRIIFPLVLAFIVPLKFYLFQDMDEVYLTSVQDTLAATLNNTTSTQGRDPQSEMKVPYTFNTLSDYITEGLEDELIWQELKYWREENQRRMENKEMVQ